MPRFLDVMSFFQPGNMLPDLPREPLNPLVRLSVATVEEVLRRAQASFEGIRSATETDDIAALHHRVADCHQLAEDLVDLLDALYTGVIIEERRQRA